MANREDVFKAWAQGPGKTEEERCENAIKAIKDAIASSSKLLNRNVEVFLQGSYRNRVNVRQDSDVDVGVICKSVFFNVYPQGTNGATFGFTTSNYKFSQFKDEVNEALINKFDYTSVTRGNKAFGIRKNSYRVDADVAPFFKHQIYSINGSYLPGVELRSDNGGGIINWPEQHYVNGVQKNTNCNRRYKRIIRIMKKLCNKMQEDGSPEAMVIPGFLCECMVWNVPDNKFGNTTYSEDLKQLFIYLYEKLGQAGSDDWVEVSKLKYLFRPQQKWTKLQARNFIKAAWDYIGF